MCPENNDCLAAQLLSEFGAESDGRFYTYRSTTRRQAGDYIGSLQSVTNTSGVVKLYNVRLLLCDEFMSTTRGQHLHTGCQEVVQGNQHEVNAPAPMVSPARLSRILPISLFTENASRGIGRALDAGPEYVELRRLISTSADMFFVSTLLIVHVQH